MELDNAMLKDSWKELEALENETKNLLETIRGKPAKPKLQSSTLIKTEKTEKKSKQSKKKKQIDNVMQASKNVKSDKRKVPSFLSSLNPFQQVTLEIFDDGPPDLSPRSDDEDISAKEKERRCRERVAPYHSRRASQNQPPLGRKKNSNQSRTHNNFFTGSIDCASCRASHFTDRVGCFVFTVRHAERMRRPADDAPHAWRVVT